MIVPQRVPTMYFVGVSTGQSVSLRMFPAWAQLLGLGEAQLLGVDVPLNAPPETYRQLVAGIKQDPLARGALITSHKLALLAAAEEEVDELTAVSHLCRELSCLYKRNGRLIGHATDPTTIGQALAHLLPADHWASHPADILCLGAGGAAVALVTHLCLAQTAVAPQRLRLVDNNPAQLDNMAALLRRLPPAPMPIDLLHHTDAAANDALLAQLPPHSLIINATGMGKDVPGSPLTENGRFPRHGWVWELNYRGERPFFHHARAQAPHQQLQVVDGWDYFLRGWSEVVALVFDIAIDREGGGALGIMNYEL